MFGFGKKKKKKKVVFLENEPLKKEKLRKKNSIKEPKDTVRFRGTQIQDKLMNELVGISFGIIADNKVSTQEAKTLKKWLVANQAVVANPILKNLLNKVNGFLQDGILDSSEALELFSILQKFAGANFEIGEVRKATRLPIDDPVADIKFSKKNFCLTGTFSFGTRKICEEATSKLGGNCQVRPTKDTDYLVIGMYVSDAWISTTYGRKIEKAMELKEKYGKLRIIGEEHWIEHTNILIK